MDGRGGMRTRLGTGREEKEEVNRGAERVSDIFQSSLYQPW